MGSTNEIGGKKKPDKACEFQNLLKILKDELIWIAFGSHIHSNSISLFL